MRRQCRRFSKNKFVRRSPGQNFAKFASYILHFDTQDLVHRLRDLQNAATEQLKVTEELQKKIVEQENVIKELNEDAETQRQVNL